MGVSFDPLWDCQLATGQRRMGQIEWEREEEEQLEGITKWSDIALQGKQMLERTINGLLHRTGEVPREPLLPI